jgi:hypothetical protein
LVLLVLPNEFYCTGISSIQFPNKTKQRKNKTTKKQNNEKTKQRKNKTTKKQNNEKTKQKKWGGGGISGGIPHGYVF